MLWEVFDEGSWEFIDRVVVPSDVGFAFSYAVERSMRCQDRVLCLRAVQGIRNSGAADNL
jgi:hypothetical protein